MSPKGLYRLLLLWDYGSWVLIVFGGLGGLTTLLRWGLIDGIEPRWWLQHGHSFWTRWVLARATKGFFPFCLGCAMVGLLMRGAFSSPDFRAWIEHDIRRLTWLSMGLISAMGVIWMLWDRNPVHIKRGHGRPDAQFRDIPEDFGRFDVMDGKSVGDGHPTCFLLAYRAKGKVSRRELQAAQRKARNLVLLSIRWEILSRHILLLGMQGSGKTTTVYGHIMMSLRIPWIYQDSKAELPLWERFPDRPVWGLDVRGHLTRSGVWNPLREISTADDFDLITKYVLPVNPRDANPWVRELSRVLFGAILRSQPWPSIQEISRTLRRTRLEPFLTLLDPIWRDLLSEPKSQVPVLQDLVATLARWEAPRVAAITEGESTVTLEDFLSLGGWAMNCEDSDALRAPVHLFWAMILGRLRNRPEGASRIVLLLDEFGDAGKLPNIVRSLVLLRSKGVSIVAGLQTIGLLRDTYPDQWQAVAQSFGSKIWLCRNAEEESRELLTRVLGKWTRVVKAPSKHSKDTETSVDLVPIDAWAHWSDERAAIARSNGYTYWLPLSLEITPTPLGEPVVAEDPWEEAQELADEALAEVSQEVCDDSPVLIEEPESQPERRAPTHLVPGLEFIRGLRFPEPLKVPSESSLPSQAIQPMTGEPATQPEEDWL